jgi:hypothetical protein
LSHQSACPTCRGPAVTSKETTMATKTKPGRLPPHLHRRWTRSVQA